MVDMLIARAQNKQRIEHIKSLAAQAEKERAKALSFQPTLNERTVQVCSG